MSTLAEKLKEIDISTDYISFYEQNLTGEIPSCISCFSNLKCLKLEGNNITGVIPDSISCLSNLKELILSKNELCGEIPSCISSLSNLQVLYLNGNKFCGEIPDFISCLSNLKELVLFDNNLSGEIPSWISCLSNLKCLNIQKNNFCGEIPSLPKLKLFFINNNYFSKPIPKWLNYDIIPMLQMNDAFQEMPESLKKQLDEEKKIRNENKLLQIQNKSKYESIWEKINTEYDWKKEDIDIIHKIEELLLQENELPNNKKTYHDMNELSSTNDPYMTIHENSIYTWEDVFSYLKEKQTNGSNIYDIHKSQLDNINEEHTDIINKQNQLEEQLEIIKHERKQIETRKEQITKELEQVKVIQKINNMIKQVEEITLENIQIKNKVKQVLEHSNNLQDPITQDDIKILLERMNLVQYYDICIESELYDNIPEIDSALLIDIEMKTRDICCFLYNIEMMKYKCYSDDINVDCIVCEHNTPIKTIELLQEWKIEIDKDIIINNNWITPYLLSKKYKEIGIPKSQVINVRKKITELKTIHTKHLNAH